jgi:hypothetical protein
MPRYTQWVWSEAHRRHYSYLLADDGRTILDTILSGPASPAVETGISLSASPQTVAASAQHKATDSRLNRYIDLAPHEWREWAANATRPVAISSRPLRITQTQGISRRASRQRRSFEHTVHQKAQQEQVNPSQAQVTRVTTIRRIQAVGLDYLLLALR